MHNSSIDKLTDGDESVVFACVPELSTLTLLDVNDFISRLEKYAFFSMASVHPRMSFIKKRLSVPKRLHFLLMIQ